MKVVKKVKVVAIFIKDRLKGFLVFIVFYFIDFFDFKNFIETKILRDQVLDFVDFKVENIQKNIRIVCFDEKIVKVLVVLFANPLIEKTIVANIFVAMKI